jgi:thiamine biosynthesis lipoprotein
MGTLFTLTLCEEDPDLADRAATAAFSRVDWIEEAATDYAAASEARRLPSTSGGEWVEVSPALGLVLRASDRLVPLSQGAFDPTVGTLTRHWRRALRQRRWPDPSVWARAAQAVGWAEQVDYQERGGTPGCGVHDPEVRLDFGGVAKGVAVDEALAAVEAHGIRRALLDGGGDVRALDPPRGAEGWRVEVLPFGEDSPTRLRFFLRRAAIATSGDVYRSGALAGEPIEGISGSADASGAMQYGHVVDPRSALPLPSPRAAVMTAATAAEADALATARMVLGPARTGVTPLERGLFFSGENTEPCVGEAFPQDGVVPIPSVTPPTGRSRPDGSLQRHRDE